MLPRLIVLLQRGIILADRKLSSAGTPTTGWCSATVFTSDSSRYWPADQWEPGRPQHAFDKQYVRSWAAGTGWDKRPPAPEVPAEVVAVTRARYLEAYERLTGRTWEGGS